MPMLKLQLENTVYFPGQKIAGTAEWAGVAGPLEIRLFWYTKGKGTMDAGIVDRVRIESPGAQGGRPFHFTAPPAPYSFSGKLISLIWAVELVAEPKGEAERVEITISPTGKEILLAGQMS